MSQNEEGFYSPILSPYFFSNQNPFLQSDYNDINLNPELDNDELNSHDSIITEDNFKIRSIESNRRNKRLQNFFKEQFNRLPNIVFDCNLEAYQTEKETFKIVQQIMLSYGHICRDPSPLHLCLAGIGPNLQSALDRIKGWKQWLCSFTNDPWEDLYPVEKLVYLSADAEDVLERFEEDKIYIIGCMVDRNRHNGLTKRIANRIGIPCQRLPIKEYVNIKSSTVLTVNQIVDILVSLHTGLDWKSTLEKTIPLRKVSKN